MSPPSPPVFGKRQAPRRRAGMVAAPEARALAPVPIIPAAETRPPQGEDDAPVRVADSYLAALLAGIVVGCGLAGLDVAGIGQTFRPIWELFAIDPDHVREILPAMILLGIIGGGRAAATTLLLAHVILKRTGQSSRLAYIVGGALTAFGFALVMHLAFGQVPPHGWAIDALAGGACGFLYHVFAGTRARTGAGA